MSGTRVRELENQLLKAKQAYYYGDAPLMDDATYDGLEEELRRLNPASDVLALVGAPVSADSMLTKARHTIAMGSQNKVNSAAEFAAWHEKVGADSALHASVKGDGASAAAYYEAGRLRQAITRGDGLEGEDVTANAVKFQGLPVRARDAQGAEFTGAVRFEVILTVADWERADPERSKNPRNRGNGIMGRKNGAEAELLTAFAFDIDEQTPGVPPLQTESDKIARLAALGFRVIPNQLCATVEEAVDYFGGVRSGREQLEFWIDGVVFKVEELELQRALGVTANRPKGQIAWKFDSQGAETTLLDYSVSVGHTGALIPTAHLEPVEIGGTTVQNALLNNWDEIARLDAAVGDRVWLIKANDIIPKITHVISRAPDRKKIDEPVACPVCGSPVRRRLNTGGETGAIIECGNDECPAKAIGKLKRWVKALDIQGIGDVVRLALVEQLGVEDAGDLYALEASPERLANLIINPEAQLRLGEKRATTILESLASKRRLTLVQLLGSLGIERLGHRRAELMILAAGGELSELAQWQSGRLRDDPDFAARVGVPNIGAGMQAVIDAQAPLIDKLLGAGVEITGPGVEPGQQSPRVTVCISGKLPSGKKKNDYALALQAIGLELVDTVTADLGYLVLADPESTSAKAKKARKHGVRIIDEQGLNDLLIDG